MGQSDQPDRWATSPGDFRYLLFERVNPEENEFRFYYLAWQPTLLGSAIVRLWGRKGETQQLRVEPFASLDEAWPSIRATIRARLRHGYRIVAEG